MKKETCNRSSYDQNRVSAKSHHASHNTHNANGISLISLIITIIVIIILAAIVIFTGLGTPDSANFAKFTQQVDNVYMAVLNKHGDLKTKHAIAGHYRTDEQIYIEIAVAHDPEQYATMGTTVVNNDNSGDSIGASTGIQNIRVNAAKDKEHSIGMTLPKVRESNTGWYVTKEGRVFNANGYVYDGKTYFSGSLYQVGSLPANETSNANRAKAIYDEAISNDVNVVTTADTVGEGEVILGEASESNNNSNNNNNNSNTPVAVTFTRVNPDKETIEAGDEIEDSSGERYFVTKVSNGTATLLTKYCLNRSTGTSQVDKSVGISDYGIAFCTGTFDDGGYWKDVATYTNDVYDLDNVAAVQAEGERATVMRLVDNFSDAKGVSARLMKYSESKEIYDGTNDDLKLKMRGKWTDGTQPTAQKYLRWWLGSASRYYGDRVWLVNGGNTNFLNRSSFDTADIGVRPVIEISVQNIT